MDGLVSMPYGPERAGSGDWRGSGDLWICGGLGARDPLDKCGRISWGRGLSRAPNSDPNLPLDPG